MQYRATVEQFYASSSDAIFDLVFELPTRYNQDRLTEVRPEALVARHKVFKPNQFAYDVPVSSSVCAEIHSKAVVMSPFRKQSLCRRFASFPLTDRLAPIIQ